MKQQFKVYDTSLYANLNVHEMLRQFHEKFGIGYSGGKRLLTEAETAFRLECHREEAEEYATSTTLVDKLDALGDELYFLAGTAHRMGLRMGELNIVAEAVAYDGPPRYLSARESSLRLSMHEGALGRVVSAINSGNLDMIYRSLAGAIHAFTTTALLHGFNVDEAIRRIHAANMCKNVDPAKQRRRAQLKLEGHDVDHMMEITKPDDWLPPFLGDLVGEGPYLPANAMTGAEPLNLNGQDVYLDVSELRGLITIDGPDHCGKSTLAQRLAEVTGGEVIHLTWTPRLAEVMDGYRMSAITYAAALAHDRVVILERPWLSHVVYTEVYRPDERPVAYGMVPEWKELTEQMAALNIMALPGDRSRWLSDYVQSCEEREQLHGPNPEKAMAVYDGFRHYFANMDDQFSPQNVEVYDIHHISTADIDNFIAHNVLPALVKGEQK